MIQQQQAKINELVSKAQVEKIQMMAEDNHISLSELDNILQPIIDTCTKDSISSGDHFSVELDEHKINLLKQNNIYFGFIVIWSNFYTGNFIIAIKNLGLSILWNLIE